MDIKITFHEIGHSDPIEAHAREKLKKVEDLLKGPEWETPKFMELWLTGHKTHPHFKAELHLKTPQFDLHTHYERTDLYFAIDTAIDRMVKVLIQEKKKIKDKKQKVETEKKEFGEDKYNL